MKYVYTVWLRNHGLPPDDPDYEWPACFIVEGMDGASAKGWADYLSERYASRNNSLVLRSDVAAFDTCTARGIHELPVVLEGEDASDAKTGW